MPPQSPSPSEDSAHPLPLPSAAILPGPDCPTIDPPLPSPTSLCGESLQKTRLEKGIDRNKQKSKGNKRSKKLAITGYLAKPKLAGKHAKASSRIASSFKADKLPISKTGYVCIDKGAEFPRETYTLADLVGPESKFQFQLQEWDGSRRLIVVDSEDRVIVVGVGAPNDSTWEAVHTEAAAALEEARGKLQFSDDATNHRRGKFSAIPVGISFGGGQKVPQVLNQNEANKPILKSLLDHRSFKRISGHTTGAFAEVAPHLYAYQSQQLTDLIQEDERKRSKKPKMQGEPFRRNFPKTAWAAATYNFGPQTVCFRHFDYHNLAFGWCCITALGKFDPTTGGHLVLWDLGLVIQFPPGSSFLIPSAAISHSNLAIGENETRYSFTQYTAGRIFSWNDNKFQTLKSLKKKYGKRKWEEAQKTLLKQLEFGLSLYTTYKE